MLKKASISKDRVLETIDEKSEEYLKLKGNKLTEKMKKKFRWVIDFYKRKFHLAPEKVTYKNLKGIWEGIKFAGKLILAFGFTVGIGVVYIMLGILCIFFCKY